MNNKWKNKKQKKQKTVEKKRKKGKEGPKGVLTHPEVGPKIDFFTKELSREIVTKLRPQKNFEHPTKKMKESDRKW